MKNIENMFDRWAAGTAGRKTREGHYFINADDGEKKTVAFYNSEVK